MNSGSWSAYRAAMPLECQGEPDDDRPRRATTWRCDRCGKFASRKPGSGSRLDVTPGSVFAGETIEWLCGACAAVTPLPPTEEQVREWERWELEAYDKAHAESMAATYAEIEAMASRCDWCGRELPSGRTVDVCEACERSVTADEPPYDGEEIPW